MKRLLILGMIAASQALACASGFISIVDPFLNPNGSAWSGSIVYTLAYNTTVAGTTIVGARQQFNVTGGINLCLAPGLYSPVSLQQSGFSYAVTNSWGVPTTGGPYTIAQIQGNITLQGGFGPVNLTGTPTTGQVPTATGPSAATWQTPGGGGSGLIQQTTTTLSQSQVLNLFSTPVTLVPAPAAGTVNLIIGAAAQSLGSATYMVDDNALLLRINTQNIVQFNLFPGVTGATTYFAAQFGVSANNYYVEGSAVTGFPIIATTSDQNPTGTGGNVIVTVYYIPYAGVSP